jgi:DUF2924 family protein
LFGIVSLAFVRKQSVHVTMAVNVQTEVVDIEELRRTPIQKLFEIYGAVVGGVPVCTKNRDYLVRRVAWALQAKAQGGLSERAQQRLSGIPIEASLRSRSSPANGAERSHSDKRSHLLLPGMELRRRLGNREIVVKVLAKGFEYDRRRYTSLSAIAREATGTRWNGRLFFGLTERRNA